MKDYKYLIHTTKRHQKFDEGVQHGDRFRIIMPMSHVLKLDGVDFKEFMDNIYEWLPFSCDEQTNQRSRKWMTHKDQHWYNNGDLLNALLFIPKTTKNEDRKQNITDQQSLSNLERWFVSNTGDGNRSNQLIKYTLLLVDAGFQFDDVRDKTLALNNKLQDKLTEAEIMSTVLVTAAKAILKRDTT